MNAATNLPNRLINEKSPYLLQHAHNPVDWYPWGDEAFNRAKAEDKPVFLSIGYSTCHWCHVMERESFENEETASYLNDHFVSVKVDREERPDIDDIYMSVCQALTGGGGWPLSVFLTPEQHPFYAGTYFPPEDRYGMPGFPSLLQGITEAWESNREKLTDSAHNIIEALSRRQPPAGLPTEDIIKRALGYYGASFDEDFGGFGHAPKFPSPHNLFFLFRCYAALGDGKALEMALSTLRAMGTGGIYDHIGGGFSRYSTDRRWLAPHFEKMLYDNALLAIAYAEAWQITKDETFALTARDTLNYILREMTDENGGFYSAEDADSEGVEGKFYLWTKEEVLAVLGQEDGTRYCELYDITEGGNFEGKNIPNLIGKTLTEEERTFAEVCAKRLFDVRNQRIHPHKDDKVLTSWNALMIAALAFCGRTLGEARYVAAAKKAAVFLLNTLLRQDGRLLARYRDGEAKYPGYADDYVFLIWAFLELYDTTFDSAFLQKAVAFAEDALNLFWDKEGGGLYLYGTDSQQLVMRPKSAYDGAIPSANSVFAMNCLRLSGLTGDPRWEKLAYELFRTFGGTMDEHPAAYSHLLTAYLYGQAEKADIVIVCPEGDSLDEFLSRLRSDYRPFVRTLVLKEDDETLLKAASFLRDYRAIEGKPTAYVCRGSVCSAPVTDSEEMMNELNKLHKLQKT